MNIFGYGFYDDCIASWTLSGDVNRIGQNSAYQDMLFGVAVISLWRCFLMSPVSLEFDLVTAGDIHEAGNADTGQETCNAVTKRCVSQIGCGMALHNLNINCQSLSYGEPSMCTDTCTRALVTLLLADSDNGLAFANCDCQGNKYCNQRKQRVQTCEEAVVQEVTSPNRTVDINCGIAKWVCQRDLVCGETIKYLMRNCSLLTNELSCTSDCKNSLEFISRQPLGEDLLKCTCSKQQETKCPRHVQVTDLCPNKNVSGHINGSGSLCKMNLVMFTGIFISQRVYWT